MVDTIALAIGYTVMAAGGAATALAVAWLVIEYYWKKGGDWRHLQDFYAWKRSQGSIPG